MNRLLTSAGSQRGRVLHRLSYWSGLLPGEGEFLHPRKYWRGTVLERQMHREGYTGLGHRRGRALVRLADSIEHEGVPGSIVDCGVWNGGSTILMSVGAPSREVWAFDSFEGMPEPGKFDEAFTKQFVGQTVGSEKKLREGFARYARVDRLRVAKGWFDETLPRFVDEIDEIAMLHIDANWYESVRQALETFYPKLSPGGYCAVDDYTFLDGTRRAVDDFREQQGISAPIVSKYYWRKPPAAASS